MPRQGIELRHADRHRLDDARLVAATEHAERHPRRVRAAARGCRRASPRRCRDARWRQRSDRAPRPSGRRSRRVVLTSRSSSAFSHSLIEAARVRAVPVGQWSSGPSECESFLSRADSGGSRSICAERPVFEAIATVDRDFPLEPQRNPRLRPDSDADGIGVHTRDERESVAARRRSSRA